MADENRSFDPTPQQANRSIDQGLGVGQREMDRQGNPTRDQHATDPQRTEPFDTDEGIGQGGDLSDRDAAGQEADAQLGAGTPANVDIHKLGQNDNPQEDWGDPADEGAVHSSTNTRRTSQSEADRDQSHGPKTRQAIKDQLSRRPT
ncbi:MAG TPA: hypothetical protein VGC92_10675 [Phenylobacterium sp.]|jgi:hypothetical protein